jgi:hypothetical protein
MYKWMSHPVLSDTVTAEYAVAQGLMNEPVFNRLSKKFSDLDLIDDNVFFCIGNSIMTPWLTPP